MGYHRHHAIVVTSWRVGSIEAAHAAATAAFTGATWCRVTAITATAMNGYRSFMVAPDGSKEGWTESDDGDAAREAFVAWLAAAAMNSVYVEWAEVEFGGDDRETMGVRGPDGGWRGEVTDRG